MHSENAEHAIARRFRLPSVPTLVSSAGSVSPITISHVRCDEPEHGTTRMTPDEDAYVAQVLLRDLPSFEISLHKKKVPTEPAMAGALFLISFQSEPIVHFHSPFDFVRFFISKASLDELAREAGNATPLGLSRPAFGTQDGTLQHLASAMLPALANPDQNNQLFTDYIALAFHAHVSTTYGGRCRDYRTARSGLSSWQARRATELIDSRLEGSLSIADLARECCLSTSHFSRAFAQTFGVPPHRWLLDRRVERAKQLILSKQLPLAEVAMACGFATQSHFSRVFSMVVGATPSNWRRMTGCITSLELAEEARAAAKRQQLVM